MFIFQISLVNVYRVMTVLLSFNGKGNKFILNYKFNH